MSFDGSKGAIGRLHAPDCDGYAQHVATMKILFVGDIVGQPGRKAVFRLLPQLSERYGGFDFVVVNGENAAGGKGLTKAIVDEFIGAGIHAITTGNHVWAQREILTFIDNQPNLVRPANYPRGAPGCGWTVVSNSRGARLGVINIAGQVYMGGFDNPFQTLDEILPEIGGEGGLSVSGFSRGGDGGEDRDGVARRRAGHGGGRDAYACSDGG